MGSEEVEIDGQLITVRPPVSNITTNGKGEVRYVDSTGPTQCQFSTDEIAGQFAAWLSGLTL